MFRGCLIRRKRIHVKITLHENYLYTFRSSYYFLIKYFFVRKSLWFRNFIVSSAKWFEAWNMRNLSCEMTTALRIHLCTRFISHMFSCCKHVSRTSRESSIASLTTVSFSGCDIFFIMHPRSNPARHATTHASLASLPALWRMPLMNVRMHQCGHSLMVFGKDVVVFEQDGKIFFQEKKLELNNFKKITVENLMPSPH